MSAERPSLDARRRPVGLCQPGCVGEKQRPVPPVTPMGPSQDRAGTKCHQAHAEEPRRNETDLRLRRGRSQVEPELLAARARQAADAAAGPAATTSSVHARKPAPHHRPWCTVSADLGSVGKATDVLSYHADPWEGQGSPSPHSIL